MTSKQSPELANWTDTGCPDGFLPSCLNCPLPRCRFEPGGGLTRGPKTGEAARREVLDLEAEGLTRPEIAARLNVSLRTVYRRLS